MKKICNPDWIRINNLKIRNFTLFPLSYGAIFCNRGEDRTLKDSPLTLKINAFTNFATRPFLNIEFCSVFHPLPQVSITLLYLPWCLTLKTTFVVDTYKGLRWIFCISHQWKLQVAHSRIELLLQEWKSCVLPIDEWAMFLKNYFWVYTLLLLRIRIARTSCQVYETWEILYLPPAVAMRNYDILTSSIWVRCSTFELHCYITTIMSTNHFKTKNPIIWLGLYLSYEET